MKRLILIILLLFLYFKANALQLTSTKSDELLPFKIGKDKISFISYRDNRYNLYIKDTKEGLITTPITTYYDIRNYYYDIPTEKIYIEYYGEDVEGGIYVYDIKGSEQKLIIDTSESERNPVLSAGKIYFDYIDRFNNIKGVKIFDISTGKTIETIDNKYNTSLNADITYKGYISNAMDKLTIYRSGQEYKVIQHRDVKYTDAVFFDNTTILINGYFFDTNRDNLIDKNDYQQIILYKLSEDKFYFQTPVYTNSVNPSRYNKKQILYSNDINGNYDIFVEPIIDEYREKSIQYTLLETLFIDEVNNENLHLFYNIFNNTNNDTDRLKVYFLLMNFFHKTDNRYEILRLLDDISQKTFTDIYHKEMLSSYNNILSSIYGNNEKVYSVQDLSKPSLYLQLKYYLLTGNIDKTLDLIERLMSSDNVSKLIKSKLYYYKSQILGQLGFAAKSKYMLMNAILSDTSNFNYVKDYFHIPMYNIFEDNDQIIRVKKKVMETSKYFEYKNVYYTTIKKGYFDTIDSAVLYLQKNIDNTKIVKEELFAILEILQKADDSDRLFHFFNKIESVFSTEIYNYFKNYSYKVAIDNIKKYYQNKNNAGVVSTFKRYLLSNREIEKWYDYYNLYIHILGLDKEWLESRLDNFEDAFDDEMYTQDSVYEYLLLQYYFNGKINIKNLGMLIEKLIKYDQTNLYYYLLAGNLYLRAFRNEEISTYRYKVIEYYSKGLQYVNASTPKELEARFYTGLAYSYYGYETLRALYYFRKRLSVSQKFPDINTEYEFYYHYAKSFYYNEENDKALKIFLELEDRLYNLDNRYLLQLYEELALTYFIKKDWKESLYYYQKALSLANTLDRKEKYSKIQRNIAVLYNRLGQISKSMEYFEKSLEYINFKYDKKYSTNKDKKIKLFGLIPIPNLLNIELVQGDGKYFRGFDKEAEEKVNITQKIATFKDNGDYLNALKYVEKHLENEDLTQKEKASWYHEKGNLNYMLGDYKTSYNDYTTSMELCEDIKDSSGIIVNLLNISKCLFIDNKMASAGDCISDLETLMMDPDIKKDSRLFDEYSVIKLIYNNYLMLTDRFTGIFDNITQIHSIINETRNIIARLRTKKSDDFGFIFNVKLFNYLCGVQPEKKFVPETIDEFYWNQVIEYYFDFLTGNKLEDDYYSFLDSLKKFVIIQINYDFDLITTIDVMYKAIMNKYYTLQDWTSLYNSIQDYKTVFRYLEFKMNQNMKNAVDAEYKKNMNFIISELRDSYQKADLESEWYNYFVTTKVNVEDNPYYGYTFGFPENSLLDDVTVIYETDMLMESYKINDKYLMYYLSTDTYTLKQYDTFTLNPVKDKNNYLILNNTFQEYTQSSKKDKFLLVPDKNFYILNQDRFFLLEDDEKNKNRQVDEIFFNHRLYKYPNIFNVRISEPITLNINDLHKSYLKYKDGLYYLDKFRNSMYRKSILLPLSSSQKLNDYFGYVLQNYVSYINYMGFSNINMDYKGIKLNYELIPREDEEVLSNYANYYIQQGNEFYKNGDLVNALIKYKDSIFYLRQVGYNDYLIQLLPTAIYLAEMVGDYEAGITYQKILNDILEFNGKVQEYCEGLNKLGYFYTLINDDTSALEVMQLAAGYYKDYEDTGNYYYTQQLIANIYERIGKYKESIDIHNAVINSGIDELAAESYYPISRLFFYIEQYDTALQYYKVSQQIIIYYDTMTQTRFFYDYGQILERVNNYDEALNKQNHALTLANELADTYFMMLIKYRIGSLYYKKGEYEKSLDYLNSVMGLANYLSDTGIKVKAYNTIGLSNLYLSEYEISNDNLKSALKLAIEYNAQDELANIYNNLALLYIQLKNYNRGLFYLNKVIEFDKLNNSTWGLLNDYRNLMKLFIFDEKYDSAIIIGRQSKKLLDELYDKKAYVYTYYYSGIAQYRLGNFRASLDNFNKALKCAEKEVINHIVWKIQTWILLINKNKLSFDDTVEACNDIIDVMFVEPKSKSILNEDMISLDDFMNIIFQLKQQHPDIDINRYLLNAYMCYYASYISRGEEIFSIDLVKELEFNDSNIYVFTFYTDKYGYISLKSNRPDKYKIIEDSNHFDNEIYKQIVEWAPEISSNEHITLVLQKGLLLYDYNFLNGDVRRVVNPFNMVDISDIEKEMKILGDLKTNLNKLSLSNYVSYMKLKNNYDEIKKYDRIIFIGNKIRRYQPGQSMIDYTSKKLEEIFQNDIKSVCCILTERVGSDEEFVYGLSIIFESQGIKFKYVGGRL